MTGNVTGSPDRNQTAFVRCGWLTAAALAIWAALAWPAWALAGTDGLEGLSIAAGLCLIPGLLVFVMAASVPAGSSSAAWLSLAGGALRLVVVLVGAMAVQAARPNLRFREFLIWLAAFYLAMLVAETFLTVRGSATSAKANSQSR